MFLPVFIVFKHLRIKNFRKFARLCISSVYQLFFDIFQCEHCFTHSKCKSRTYFQNADSVFYKLAQFDLCLIICRMSFKYQCREIFDRSHQIFCFLTIIFCTSAVFFFYTRLNNNSDYTLPYIFVKTFFCKSFLKCRNCVLKIFYFRHLNSVIFRSDSSSRNRHFTSDYIYRRNCFRITLQQLFICLFRNFCKMSAASCNDLVGQTNVFRIAVYFHTCIDMNLCKSCCNIVTDQLFRISHRLCFIFIRECKRS